MTHPNQPINISNDSSSPDNNALRQQLIDVCSDLWWVSESEYPVQPVWTHQSLSELLSSAPQPQTISTDLDRLFSSVVTHQSWHTPEDTEQTEAFTKLKQLLSQNLSDVKIYRCGEVEITLYVLGYQDQETTELEQEKVADQSDRRAIAGIQTLLVET